MSNGTLPTPLVVENSNRWLGNDGTWSTFSVHVGTPPQTFYVLPSIRGQTIYVPIEDDCRRLNITDCGESRGAEVFESRPSLGFQVNSSSTWEELGIYRIAVDSDLGLSGNAMFGYDTVGPSSGGASNTPKLDKQAVAAYASPQFWVGMLGLNQFALNISATEQPRSFLSALKEEGIIPSLSYGYQAGASYRYTQVTGSLTLGGYDRSRGSNNSLLVPFDEELIIGVQSITSKSNNGTLDLLDEGILAFVDSTVPDLWLPRSVCDTIASAFALEYQEASNRYTLPDPNRAALRDLSPTLSMTLGSSVRGGQTITLEVPYAAFDLEADFTFSGERTNYFPIRRAANESQYTLGRALLQEMYLTVDWERRVFNVSQAVFSAPMPESDIVTIQPKGSGDLTPLPGPNGSDPKKSLSGGAIAGIVVGSVAALLLVGALLWWFIRRKRRVTKLEGPGFAFEPEVEHEEEEKKSPAPDDRGHLAPEIAGPGVVSKGTPGVGPEGGAIAELSAPHGQSEVMAHEGTTVPETEPVVELGVPSPPVPVYELPAASPPTR